jgi:hypothetical protein
MQTLELPDKLVKRLESFKRAKGRKWTKELDDYLKREAAKTELMNTVRELQKKNRGFRETDVLRRLTE